LRKSHRRAQTECQSQAQRRYGGGLPHKV
jgi:hypothetical protein